MDKEELQGEREDSTRGLEVSVKKSWQDPKLTFVEPKLTKHGDLKEVTAFGGFFGTFTP